MQHNCFNQAFLILFQCDIDVYHDVEQRIIYLHLVSVYDVPRLLQLCKQAPQEVQNAVSWSSKSRTSNMYTFSV